MEGIDIVDGFVPADGVDAGETEGEAGIVTFGWLDRVEGDLEDDGGFDQVLSALFFDGRAEEVAGEVLDFGIGQAGVGFSDDTELSGLFVADGEGVVGEDFRPFTVALFGGDDYAIEGVGGFEFEPAASSTAREVGGFGVFGDEAFLSCGAGGLEEGFGLCGGVGVVDADGFEGGREVQLGEALAPFPEGRVDAGT